MEETYNSSGGRISITSALQQMYSEKDYAFCMPQVRKAIHENREDLGTIVNRGSARGYSLDSKYLSQFKQIVERITGITSKKKFVPITFREYELRYSQRTDLNKRLRVHPKLEKYRRPAGSGGFQYEDCPEVWKIVMPILEEMGIQQKDGVSIAAAPINHSLVTRQSNIDIYRQEMMANFFGHR